MRIDPGGCWLCAAHEGRGQVLGLSFSGFGCGGAGPEAEAVIACLEDVAMMGEAIQQGGGHLCIAEDASPFAKAQVGGDHDAGALVEFAEQVEQQRATRWAEG